MAGPMAVGWPPGGNTYTCTWTETPPPTGVPVASRMPTVSRRLGPLTTQGAQLPEAAEATTDCRGGTEGDGEGLVDSTVPPQALRITAASAPAGNAMRQRRFAHTVEPFTTPILRTATNANEKLVGRLLRGAGIDGLQPAGRVIGGVNHSRGYGPGFHRPGCRRRHPLALGLRWQGRGV